MKPQRMWMTREFGTLQVYRTKEKAEYYGDTKPIPVLVTPIEPKSKTAPKRKRRQ